MIIDMHAHITGPQEIWEHFRELAGMAPGVKPQPLQLSDDQLRESLKEHMQGVQDIGTDMQFVVGRPWAVPTAFRRESTVMYIAQQINDMFARCIKLFPNRFVGMATLPETVGVSPKHSVEELERCVKELGFVGLK